jgi:Na+-transporting NADH:ubiquinone oxidoreductase subunit A
MSKTVKLRKGFDINLAGKAENKLADTNQPETFAIKPTDFPGMLRPKALVAVGDNVKAGTPVLLDKKHEDIMFAAPVSGEVVDVKRGAKRALLEIVILADREIEYEIFDRYSLQDINKLDRETLTRQMLKAGVWPHVIQRPYGVIANPAETPKSIFISAFDTSPLAPDYNFSLKGEEKAFQAGIDILKKFTKGTIHVDVSALQEVNSLFTKTEGVQLNKIAGIHPAGNVGVQIHHIDPIGKDDLIWTVKPFGVIQIGRLFLEGKLDTAQLVALTGSEISSPQYYKTYGGAAIKKFVTGNLKNEHVRYISGNVLTGENIGLEGHLGFYDQQFTVIPEGDKPELFGWMLPTTKQLSFHKAFGLFSFLNSSKKEYVIDSNTKGEPRAFVMTGAFEKVVPMDILPTYLLKAILAEDFDDMEALGIYEVVEEDLALCEFIDVSKHDIQSIVRDGLNLMQYS